MKYIHIRCIKVQQNFRLNLKLCFHASYVTYITYESQTTAIKNH